MTLSGRAISLGRCPMRDSSALELSRWHRAFDSKAETSAFDEPAPLDDPHPLRAVARGRSAAPAARARGFERAAAARRRAAQERRPARGSDHRGPGCLRRDPDRGRGHDRGEPTGAGRPSAAKEAPARAAVVRPDDGWFCCTTQTVARSVGCTPVTTAQDGSFAVNEEYEFVNGVRRYQVTNRCTAGPDGRGAQLLLRERVSKPVAPADVPRRPDRKR